ncbi:L-fuculokinase [Olsenella sp. Marseille-P4559]|uniref:FGGY-family carbohydrate kinase n=1 Tax=Olsenella sp. Marseille-P4559 TaxID=2364795 RepID=UPI001032546B|nr:FGGY family carbohydrate kinase [Olsenella sp. Marseille-P4559]
MPFAIGIDVGTTNTKAALFGLPSCNPIHIERMPSPRIIAGDNTDYDIRALVRGIMDMLSSCVASAGEYAREIEFVSIASVGESGVLVRSDGTYSDKSIFWYDNRGESYAEEAISSGYSSTLYRITGIPTHSNSTLFKILWMREHGANLQGATWLTMADFVAWLLSGQLAQDRTLASRTSAYDVLNDRMSVEILDHYGLPRQLFAPLEESGASRGRVRSKVSQRTGLPKECMVCVSGHDHMSGAAVCNLRVGTEALNSTGTSEGLLLLNARPSLTDSSMERQITNGRYVETSLFTSYASVPSAGLSFEWSLKTLGYEPDDYYKESLPKLYESYLEGEFDDTRVLFVPHLRGSGPPYRDAGSRALFYGMRDATDRDELVFATHSGTTMEFARLCDCMTDGKGLGEDVCVKVIGPAARNPLWMQLKADLLGIPFVACDVVEAVSRGAVIVAARKNGIDVDPQFSTTAYQPSPERHDILDAGLHESYIPLCDSIARFERHHID